MPAPQLSSVVHSRNINRSYQRLPRHIQKIKIQAEEKKPRPPLSSVNSNLKAENGKLFGDGPLAARNEGSPSSSFSETSETESQQDFVGFRKTRDFGDFVTFSNSPSQV